MFTDDIFIIRATTFAQTFPEATLAMPAPELAVDDLAREHHGRDVCETVRRRMIAAARDAMGVPSPSACTSSGVAACRS